MAAEKEPDDKAMNADPWIIDGMLPIAVAHAEAAAKAADMTLGEWLSRLIADQTPTVETSESIAASGEASDLPKSK